MNTRSNLFLLNFCEGQNIFEAQKKVFVTCHGSQTTKNKTFITNYIFIQIQNHLLIEPHFTFF